MIEMGMTDLLVWGIGLTLLLIGLLRILSKLRREAGRSRQKRRILFCNICVKYFVDDSDDQHVCCPKCERMVTRGRNRKLG